MPSKPFKIRRSFPRLVLGIIYILAVLWFAQDLARADEGPFWPGVALMALGFGIRFWSHGHIRKGESLATGGPYGLCRNPLYLGSFINGIGIGVAAKAWIPLAVLAVPLLIAYYIMIRGEEQSLERHYGDEYMEYRKKVPALLPLPTRYFFRPKERFSFKTALDNRGWASPMYFLITFLALDLVIFVIWPSIQGSDFFTALASYFTNFISNHF